MRLFEAIIDVNHRAVGWRGDLSGTLVSDAGRTKARAQVRSAAVAAVEKVGVKTYTR